MRLRHTSLATLVLALTATVQALTDKLDDFIRAEMQLLRAGKVDTMYRGSVGR